MGSHAYSAEYLCNPMAAGSQLFYEEYFTERYTELPPQHHLFSIVSVDPARTTQDARKGSDTAILGGSIEKVSNGFDPLVYIRAAKVGHLAPLERARAAVQMAVDIKAQAIWIEDTTKGKDSASAPSDIKELVRQCAADMNVDGQFLILVHRPDVDKYVRAGRAASHCERGVVLWPLKLAGDMYVAYNQLILYPNVSKNDAVDSFDQLIEKLMQRHAGGGRRWPEGGTKTNHAPAYISKRTLNQPLTRAVGWR